MLVVTRYVVPEEEAAVFAEQARAALDALRERPGCRAAVLGRAADDPTLWTLTTGGTPSAATAARSAPSR